MQPLTQHSNSDLRLKMFSNLIRDFKISRNHRKRVNSIVLRTNEEIVRTLDLCKAKHLEAERKEDKDNTLKYKSMFEMLEWLIDDSK